ncbi:SGNH/GDSL hydrolase family protein [Streptomyces sp. NPDC050560]|uniref:SGNH/GDSL hydrolase family protein n=1 Tax=Streptomyces sp. NPDC050560 TaxID=3365630 RepID=UPI00378A7AFB
MRGSRRSRTGVRTASAVAAVALCAAGLTTYGVVHDGGGHGSAARSAKPRAPRPERVWDTSPSSLAAVGDSMTRGFDACSVLTDCPEVSWSTGSDPDVDSLAVRLLGREGAAKHSWNYARTGARMRDVAGQIEKAAPRSPGLVTVLAGANDACRDTVQDMTPVADFRTAFHHALAVAHDRLPKSEVYVASVPDLKRLWSQGRGNPLGRQVWKLGICPTMLEDSGARDAAATRRRDAVRERVVAYNSVLREECAAVPRCRFDDGAVFEYRFGTGQLSHWDWFHPSRDGQARLAEIAFARVTAPEAVS